MLFNFSLPWLIKKINKNMNLFIETFDNTNCL